MFTLNGYILDLYKTWAPNNSDWAVWAKPVLFASMGAWGLPKDMALEIPEVPISRDLRTMIIVDMPGIQSISEALGYAAKGWRPVPLYNGVMSAGQMLVDVFELVNGLQSGAKMLDPMSIPLDAPPVFMLDSRRMYGSKIPGTFDNRWCVFQQDMPSAAYLKSKGIDKIIVRVQMYVLEDLEQILYDYQKNGIALYMMRNAFDSPKEMTARKLSSVKGLVYRAAVVFGLRRNSAGGFGSTIPLPREQRFVGYHRYG